jgi:hypothetical protein
MKLAVIRELAHYSQNVKALARQQGVDLSRVVEFRLCEYMATMGFSYKCIAAATGLSTSQVGSRLRSGGTKISVKDYRNGENPVSEAIIGKLDAAAQRRYIDAMEGYLLK